MNKVGLQFAIYDPEYLLKFGPVHFSFAFCFCSFVFLKARVKTMIFQILTRYNPEVQDPFKELFYF